MGNGDLKEKNVNLDIVLPCYNPLPNWSKNIVSNIRTIETHLPNVNIQLYVVNDGASKNISTTDIEYLTTHIPTFQYIHYTTNQGKGYALRQGVSATSNSVCIFTDIDFPYELESFLKIYAALVDGADIAVGVRSPTYYKNVPRVRIWISKFLKFLIRNFLSIPIDDTQGGLKGFNQKGKEIFLKTTINRYLFDLEFIYTASKNKNLTIQPIEVELKEGIVFSNMNAKVLYSEGLSFLKIFLKR